MSTPSTTRTIAVVGGGLAGFAAAASLARPGYRIIHIAPETGHDRRTSALMGPSVDFLQQTGLIDDPDALGVPLKEIRIIDATSRLFRAPETLFTSAEADQQQFGWNFANTKLTEAFAGKAQAAPNYERQTSPLSEISRQTDGFALNLEDGTRVTCDLLIGADGKKSLVRKQAGIAEREHKFDQSALVCDLRLERPIGNTSIEFHYPNGPFTLVPAGGDNANLVWIDRLGTLQTAKDATGEDAANILAERSQHLFGHVNVLTSMVVFPLSILHAETAGRDGIVLLGEAAHAFPPIGAQGLNLSLRDVADMGRALESIPSGTENWAAEVSATYARSRKSDLGQTASMVETLFRSLLSDLLPAQALRTVGLWSLKLNPSLRRKAFGLGMGIR